MIILSIFSQRSRNIWMTRTVDFWKTCSRGHRTCRRTAGNPEKRSERKIGANLSLSYRFAPVLYRYGLSTVYVTNHCNPFIYHFVKTIQQCVDKTRKKLHNKKNVYIIVSQKISNKLKE